MKSFQGSRPSRFDGVEAFLEVLYSGGAIRVHGPSER